MSRVELELTDEEQEQLRNAQRALRAMPTAQLREVAETVPLLTHALVSQILATRGLPWSGVYWGDVAGRMRLFYEEPDEAGPDQQVPDPAR